MGKGRMLLVSGMITICLVTVGSIVLLFMSNESPLNYFVHKEEKMETSVALAEGSAEEPVEVSEPEEVYTGIRLMTDEKGTHDILFESGEVAYTAVSGPMKLTVTHVTLEQLTPANEHIKKLLGGRNRSTLALLKIEVENQAGETVHFRIDEAKIQADTNESSIFHPALSDQLGTEFAPKEIKQGLVAVDFQAEPRDIAVLEVKVSAPYDKNYDSLGEMVTLKVPMY